MHSLVVISGELLLLYMYHPRVCVEGVDFVIYISRYYSFILFPKLHTPPLFCIIIIEFDMTP